MTTCTKCGACCVTYRVAFGCAELDASPDGHVPAALVEWLDERRVCMRGTNLRSPRCISLMGTVGGDVACAIYDRRPSPCREFSPQANNGTGDMCCADARRLHGLPPLSGSYDAGLLA